jgi:glutathione S-transferase
MLRLWGRDTSSNVMKVIWLLEALQIAYERIDVGGPFGGTQTPEYLAINPTGLVPTLDDDGFTLWESNAILRYLCTNRAPEAALFGPGAARRGRIDQWLDYQQTTLNRPQSILFIGYVRTPADERDTAAIAKALNDAGRAWSVVNAQLATGSHRYIVEDELSLADIAFGVHVHRWFNLPIERPDLPALSDWYHRLLELPLYARHIARPLV